MPDDTAPSPFLRGLGHREAPPDDRDWPAERLGLTGAGALPPVGDLTAEIDRIRDQGATSSCVGHAVARAWHLRARVQGDARVEHPSALDVYAVARVHESPGAPLVDAGSIVRDALQALDALGACPESAWPFDADLVNSIPPWDARRSAADRRSVRYARLFGADAVRRAIAAGHPVVLGCAVDQAFMDLRAHSTWPGLRGESLGGHATCIVGYEPGALLLCNSWGESWSDHGLGWIADRAVDSAELWAVEVVSP